MRTVAKAFSACVFILAFLGVQASAMRCGNNLAHEGMNKLEVVHNCGEPLSKRVVKEMERTIKDKNEKITEKIVVEEWVYDVGDGVLHTLTFENDVLKKISWIRK
ncbi:MAG: DUF2845 domain-containing protein [Thermodesulfobacteriota bacterium]